MKRLLWLTVGLLALVILAWSAVAFAQAPVGNDPAAATYLDNQPHTIAGNGVMWFRFDYGGGGSLVRVTLIDGAGSNLRFNVFTPDQMSSWVDATPIGRGTVLAVNCNSGLPAPGGGCQGNDLVWEGKFRFGGTFYVQLFNDNPQPVGFTLTVAGDDVVQCVQPGQTSPIPNAPPCAPSAANATPLAPQEVISATVVTLPTVPMQTIPPSLPLTVPQSVTPTVTVTITSSAPVTPGQPTAVVDVNAPNTFYTSPYHALPLSGQLQTIPANASIWYRFEYDGDGSNIVLRLENGVPLGLEFALYLPEQAKIWFDESPIGRGTGTLCTTESQDPSSCGENANALLWSGKFQAGGTYFVRVTNPTSSQAQFLLTVSGTGVHICPTAEDLTTRGGGFVPCPATGTGAGAGGTPTLTPAPPLIAPTNTPGPTATPTASG